MLTGSACVTNHREREPTNPPTSLSSLRAAENVQAFQGEVTAEDRSERGFAAGLFFLIIFVFPISTACSVASFSPLASSGRLNQTSPTPGDISWVAQPLFLGGERWTTWTLLLLLADTPRQTHRSPLTSLAGAVSMMEVLSTRLKAS